jgi:hypothetical protein
MLGDGNPANMLGDGNPVNMLGDGNPVTMLGDGIPVNMLGDGNPVNMLGDGIPVNMLGDGNPVNMLGDGNPVNMLGVTGSRELAGSSPSSLIYSWERCLERPSKFLHLPIYVCNIKRTPLCDEKTPRYRPTELRKYRRECTRKGYAEFVPPISG